jgi:hypothetical protein
VGVAQQAAEKTGTAMKGDTSAAKAGPITITDVRAEARTLQKLEFFRSLSSREQNSRKERMVDIILLLMAIPSAISLLVVSPRDLQRKAILALREHEEMGLSRRWSWRRWTSQGNPDE